MYYRVHWDDPQTFAPERATSAPWGETECARCSGSGVIPSRAGERECPACEGTGEAPRVPGYSCCDSATALLRYFTTRLGIPEGRCIVEFTGSRVGTGPDGEPLVIPDMQHIRWLDEAELRRLAEAEVA